MNNDRSPESAFPHDVDVDGQCGMTLRDYFAAQVIPTVLAGMTNPVNGLPYAARVAYQIADAMLQGRKL